MGVRADLTPELTMQNFMAAAREACPADVDNVYFIGIIVPSERRVPPETLELWASAAQDTIHAIKNQDNSPEGDWLGNFIMGDEKE